MLTSISLQWLKQMEYNDVSQFKGGGEEDNSQIILLFFKC